MNDPNDQQLLRDYLENDSERAFSDLVDRYVDLVYSAALRMVNDSHAAKDVTQSVFVTLADNAHELVDRPVLAGWLHCTARNLATKTIRSEVRRRAREKDASAMNQSLSDSAEPDWESLAPHLDQALDGLEEEDRDAVLLRYFRGLDLRAVGEKLGISDDAAQKRVSRAVEKLRDTFSKRGITVGTGGLTIALSSNAVHAAPVGLTASVASAVLAGKTAAAASTLVAAQTITMTTIQKTVVSATVAVLAGVGVYETRRASQLNEQVEVLQQDQLVLSDELQQLRSERDTAMGRVASLLNEQAELKRNDAEFSELLELRGKVGVLQRQLSAAKTVEDPFVWDALDTKSKMEKLRQLFAEKPGERIPEMQFLSEQDWMNIARNADLYSPEGIRLALSRVRHVAKNWFIPKLQQALVTYLDSNDGYLPSNVRELHPFFEEPVDVVLLDQWELIQSGRMSEVDGGYVIRVKNLVDPEYDYPWRLGPHAFSPGSSGLETAVRKADEESMTQLMGAFMAANNGKTPTSLTDLRPFVTTPAQQEAYDRWSKSGFTVNVAN